MTISTPIRSTGFLLSSKTNVAPAWLSSLPNVAPVNTYNVSSALGHPVPTMQWVQLSDAADPNYGIGAAYVAQYPSRGAIVSGPWTACLYQYTGTALRRIRSTVLAHGAGHQAGFLNHVACFPFGDNLPAWFIGIPPSLQSDFQFLGSNVTDLWTTAETVPANGPGTAAIATAVCPHWPFCTGDDMYYNDGAPAVFQNGNGNHFIDHPSFDALVCGGGLSWTGGYRRSYKTDGVTAISAPATSYWKFGNATWRDFHTFPAPGTANNPSSFRYFEPYSWQNLMAVDKDNAKVYVGFTGFGLVRWNLDPTGAGTLDKISSNTTWGQNLGSSMVFDPSRNRLVFANGNSGTVGSSFYFDVTAGTRVGVTLSGTAAAALCNNIFLGYTQGAPYVPAAANLHAIFQGGDCFLFAFQKSPGPGLQVIMLNGLGTNTWVATDISSAFGTSINHGPQWAYGGVFHKLHYAQDIGCLVFVAGSAQNPNTPSTPTLDTGCYAIKITN